MITDWTKIINVIKKIAPLLKKVPEYVGKIPFKDLPKSKSFKDVLEIIKILLATLPEWGSKEKKAKISELESAINTLKEINNELSVVVDSLKKKVRFLYYLIGAITATFIFILILIFFH
ncbi:MAG: hypothetical protein LWX70_09010 [Sphingobacteriia bacterium]|nr:hypothetical protein [Sphingobacteriia bacterium]